MTRKNNNFSLDFFLKKYHNIFGKVDSNPFFAILIRGVAQMVERCVRDAEAVGSNPVTSIFILLADTSTAAS